MSANEDELQATEASVTASELDAQAETESAKEQRVDLARERLRERFADRSIKRIAPGTTEAGDVYATVEFEGGDTQFVDNVVSGGAGPEGPQLFRQVQDEPLLDEPGDVIDFLTGRGIDRQAIEVRTVEGQPGAIINAAEFEGESEPDFFRNIGAGGQFDLAPIDQQALEEQRQQQLQQAREQLAGRLQDQYGDLLGDRGIEPGDEFTVEREREDGETVFRPVLADPFREQIEQTRRQNLRERAAEQAGAGFTLEDIRISESEGGEIEAEPRLSARLREAREAAAVRAAASGGLASSDPIFSGYQAIKDELSEDFIEDFQREISAAKTDNRPIDVSIFPERLEDVVADRALAQGPLGADRDPIFEARDRADLTEEQNKQFQVELSEAYTEERAIDVTDLPRPVQEQLIETLPQDTAETVQRETLRSEVVEQTGLAREEVVVEETEQGGISAEPTEAAQEREALEDISRQFEEQFGRELERGEEFVLEETEEGGFEGVLTDEFRQEISGPSLAEQIEDQYGDLFPGREFEAGDEFRTVEGEEEGELLAELTESFREDIRRARFREAVAEDLRGEFAQIRRVFEEKVGPAEEFITVLGEDERQQRQDQDLFEDQAGDREGLQAFLEPTLVRQTSGLYPGDDELTPVSEYFEEWAETEARAERRRARREFRSEVADETGLAFEDVQLEGNQLTGETLAAISREQARDAGRDLTAPTELDGDGVALESGEFEVGVEDILAAEAAAIEAQQEEIRNVFEGIGVFDERAEQRQEQIEALETAVERQVGEQQAATFGAVDQAQYRQQIERVDIERGEDFTVDVGEPQTQTITDPETGERVTRTTTPLTAELAEDTRRQLAEQATAFQLGRQFGGEFEAGQDFTLEESEDGGLQPVLTDEGRATARTENLRGAVADLESQVFDVPGLGQFQFDVPGEGPVLQESDPDRDLGQTDIQVRASPEDEFTTFEDALASFEEDILEATELQQPAVQAAEGPARGRAGAALRTERENFETGAGTTPVRQFSQAALRGIPLLATGAVGLTKDAADFGGALAGTAEGVQVDRQGVGVTFDEERINELFGNLEGAAVETGVLAAETAAEDPGEFAARGAGTLVASVPLFGAARAVGPRTSLGTRLAVQPGEEIVGIGGNRLVRASGRAVGRPEGGARVAERLFPDNEPLIFSEEAAIRGGRAVGRRLQSGAGRVGRRARTEGTALRFRLNEFDPRTEVEPRSEIGRGVRESLARARKSAEFRAAEIDPRTEVQRPRGASRRTAERLADQTQDIIDRIEIENNRVGAGLGAIPEVRLRPRAETEAETESDVVSRFEEPNVRNVRAEAEVETEQEVVDRLEGRTEPVGSEVPAESRRRIEGATEPLLTNDDARRIAAEVSGARTEAVEQPGVEVGREAQERRQRAETPAVGREGVEPRVDPQQPPADAEQRQRRAEAALVGEEILTDAEGAEAAAESAELAREFERIGEADLEIEGLGREIERIDQRRRIDQDVRIEPIQDRREIEDIEGRQEVKVDFEPDPDIENRFEGEFLDPSKPPRDERDFLTGWFGEETFGSGIAATGESAISDVEEDLVGGFEDAESGEDPAESFADAERDILEG